MVDELLHQAWAARRDFVFTVEPLRTSVARAKAMAPEKGPIFLLDHYDNCASGGTMDTTAVLAEILRQDLDDVAFFGIYDPAPSSRRSPPASGRASSFRSAASSPCRRSVA